MLRLTKSALQSMISTAALLLSLQACIEWFVRLRPGLMKLAAALSQHAATAYHGQGHLATLQKHHQSLHSSEEGQHQVHI